MLKRIFLAFLAGAAVWFMPRLEHPATDIGRLEPVEAVRLTVTESGVLLETDTGSSGAGKTLEEAAADLKNGAPGEVFLETADKLLITGDLGTNWETVYELFRPGCQVCAVQGEVDLIQAAAYLEVHRSGLNLGQLRGNLGTWSELIMEEGRGRLVPK